MYNHAPPGYVCPFCLVVQGIENEHVYTKQQDIVYQDENVTAFISAGWWPNNPGHVLIVPNRHFENMYDLPLSYAGAIQQVAQQLALAMKETYRCDGVSTRQHNEPAGNQDVWHYHLHLFPRYTNDDLYQLRSRFTTPKERLPYANKLKAYLEVQR